MTLEESLKKAAYKIWDELEPIQATSTYKIFEVREEALTTMAIKELFRANCAQISKVEMIPGSEENLKGYDFEMAIGSRLTGKYVRLFVQAKRLYGKSTKNGFDALDFDQTNILINYSRSFSSLGIYAFYNHLIENDVDLMNHYNSITPFDKKSLGITIASAYSIKMLQSKKFSDYHFNNGHKINPQLYSLRHYPHLFYFHRASGSHLAIPFHELSYFSIALAERINRMYRRIKARSKAHFFFFFLPGIENLFDDEKDIIPILNTNIDELISDFRRRADQRDNTENTYRPQVLIIIDTGENNEK
jgi:hypothetical protein